MKIILLIFQILCFSQIVFGQEDNVIFKLYERNCQTNDTTEFCSIVGDSKGYKFVFPAKEMISYRLKDSLNKAYDTIKESFSSLYGPFVFVKRKGKIMFKDLSKSRKLFDLYNINYRQFLAPELFSSSTDSYNIFTNLLNSSSATPFNTLYLLVGKCLFIHSFINLLSGRLLPS